MKSTRRAAVAVAIVALGSASCSDSDTANDDAEASARATSPVTLLDLPAARPGDIVGLAADDGRRIVSWLHRIDGTVHELGLDGVNEPGETTQIVATIEVSTESQQGGLLDQVLLADGRRVLTWTTPEANELVVGTLAGDDGTPMIFWSAGEAGSGAIGGKLDLTDDGRLLVSIGRNTDFDTVDDQGGAFLAFDVASLGSDDVPLEPTVISRGYTNPWAFESLTGGEIWVWDNAAGSDPDDRDLDDVERIGRVDLEPDRNDMVRSEVGDRAPAAMVELPDGRLGVCGFLDNELRAYEVVDGDDGPRTRLERAGTIMACNTAATVFADGTVVTAAQTDAGESLQVLRP